MPQTDSNLYQKLLFNYCRIGSVFRAVMLVETVTAIGLLYIYDNFLDWFTQFALSNSAIMPPTLLWLIIGCLSKDLLSEIPKPVQFLFGISTGAMMGVLASNIPYYLDLSDHRLTFAGALTGAGLSSLLLVFASHNNNSLKRLQIEAQLKVLQARVQPHFLFNSLNSAIALVRSEPKKAQVLLEDLSDLFRNALRSHDAPITLDGELELTRQYLAIESLRFGSRLQVVWEIDAFAKTALVPTLLLQPLVENVIHHAVEKSNQEVLLHISALKTGKMVHVKIRNTRSKMDMESHSVATFNLDEKSFTKNQKEGFGIGLASVEQKLKLFFDIEAFFQVKKEADFFEVEMRFPLQSQSTGF